MHVLQPINNISLNHMKLECNNYVCFCHRFALKIVFLNCSHLIVAFCVLFNHCYLAWVELFFCLNSVFENHSLTRNIEDHYVMSFYDRFLVIYINSTCRGVFFVCKNYNCSFWVEFIASIIIHYFDDLGW